MVKSKFRGHDIVYKNGWWFYEETGLPTVETHLTMPCGKCGKMPTHEGHDPCLGILPGLMNACCGHGEIGEAYIQFLDGESIHGEDAVTIIEVLKKYRIK